MAAKSRHGNATRAGQSPEYKAWCHMKERCLNETHPKYSSYGGRGITVCPEWQASFQAFLRDMGPKPSPELTLEREDNDKGYCPENCVWASRKAQANNTRKTVHHELNGETLNQSDWARRAGIAQPTISHRLKRGWTVEDALTTPGGVPERLPLVEFNGEAHNLYEWSRITGIDYRALHSRFKRGWHVRRMLTQPAPKRTRKAI